MKLKTKMNKNCRSTPHSLAWNFRFACVSVVGSLLMAVVSVFAPLDAQIAVLGAAVSTLLGLLLSYAEQVGRWEDRKLGLLRQLSLPVTLAQRQELYRHYVAVFEALSRVAMNEDAILQEIAALKAASFSQEIASLADGTVVFTGTEAWRTVYNRLLESPEIREYQSVAWVRHSSYWQDAPGQQSMNANFAAVRRGVLIERIVILTDDLWPREAVIPPGPIGRWIESQHDFGMWICLVRESELSKEPDLLCDMGIYGDRAWGVQELDQDARTLRFLLRFDGDSIRLARDRWQRLLLFATPFRHLLDQLPDDE